MPDREKVIKGLHQHCEGSMFDRCGECPYYEIKDEPFQCRDDLLHDALALLKEQELVRCKDCRHCTFSDGEQLADCMIKQGWFPVKPDWFCADGERKTDDA